MTTKTEAIKIFDTTLRDGEQCPGASLQHAEKLQIARQLERLGVDIIEAGFPVASPDDFRAVHAIAKAVTKSTVCGLSRAVATDILTAAEAIAPAKKQRIHTFIATSQLHMRYKLKMSEAEVLARITEMVSLAHGLCRDVEFSAEDASRSDPKFLMKAFKAAVKAGATTLNVPDTVGYASPAIFGAFVGDIAKKFSKDATISVHCHDDLGQAAANSLAAVQAGARQIECTINGLGERAGNTALEEVVMAIRTQKDIFKGLRTRINTKELARTSRLVSQLTSFPVPPNKAIVGSNAFAHESGIHQDGIIKKRETYEIMRAEDIGLKTNKLVLGKHSGRNALKTRLAELGYELDKDELTTAFQRFKELADQKKEVFDEDLEAIINHDVSQAAAEWQVLGVSVTAGNKRKPSAEVELMSPTGKKVTKKATGTGPVDAVYAAIDKAMKTPVELLEFSMQAVTAGIDAQAVVAVKVEVAGKKVYSGKAADTDIIVASAKSYVAALNTARARQ